MYTLEVGNEDRRFPAVAPADAQAFDAFRIFSNIAEDFPDMQGKFPDFFEFAVLLEHCSKEVALRIGCEISDAVCSEKFSWDGRQFVVGISIGMVEVNSSCADSDTAMAAADGACYLAKQLGGCQVQSWAPALPNNEKVH